MSLVPAYLISEFAVESDHDAARYAHIASASVSRHGGRYLVQGASPEVPEGDWPTGTRISIVEFPTMSRLLAWYRSSDYAEALAVRTATMSRRLLLVEGAREPAFVS
jgi:uncharacterized protein (DUF1330 family)